MTISKKMAKVLTALAIILTISASISLLLNGTVFADYPTITATSSPADKSVSNLSGMILSIVQIVGVAVAVIMLIVLAIKYISAAPSEKADIKKSATVYIVGAIILFAAAGLLEIIKQFAGAVKAS